MRLSVRILPVLMTCLLLCACEGHKVDNAFVVTSDCNLRVKDQTVFTYDPLTCQTSFNREKGEFRVHTDNMSDYYCVTLRSIPTTEGQKVKGGISWTSSSSVVTRNGLTFSVEKADRSGRYWLWCRKERIGVVVQVLD